VPGPRRRRGSPIEYADDSFEGHIASFLRLEGPATYCDPCLAFVLRLDVAAVARATTTLADGETLARGEGYCDQCDRFGPVTCSA
jgi:hypothetical protein